MSSNKMSYVVAGSLVGGAVGYLFLTESGKKTVRSVRNFDPKTIPQKLEELRGVVERGGRDVTRRVETVRHRVQESYEAGRNAYTNADDRVEAQVRRLESFNNEVAGGIHHAVDELNKTVLAFEKSILGPIYEMLSLVEAVKRGVNALKEGPKPLTENTSRMTGLR